MEVAGVTDTKTNHRKLQTHSSLKSVLKELREDQVNASRDAEERREEEEDINEALTRSGPLTRSVIAMLGGWSSRWVTNAGMALIGGDAEALAEPFRRIVEARSLAFYFKASVPLAGFPNQYPLPFTSSMQAVGPTVLGQWDEGGKTAFWLIDVAQYDQDYKSDLLRKDGWGKGTHDAFLIYLLAGVYGFPTHYEPIITMRSAYRDLLEHWRTTDIKVFQRVMGVACDAHVERSGLGTDRVTYEFEDYFNRMFPLELMVVQALRRHEGLPEFEANHTVLDSPWSLIRDLPEIEPHPLLQRVEARLNNDYPAFRDTPSKGDAP